MRSYIVIHTHLYYYKESSYARRSGYIHMTEVFVHEFCASMRDGISMSWNTNV